MSDDLVLAGAPNAESAKGLAYVFRDNAGTWTETKHLAASDRAANHQFGSSVSISSLPGNAHVALVGAPQANNFQGAAYVYTFPAPVPTPASGSPVSVAPTDPLTQISATVTFPNVTQAGETSVATIDSAQAPPLGFTPSGTTTYFDLTTTAQYGTPIQVCFSYAGIPGINEATLRLLHYENGAWVDVTAAGSPDTANDIICGTVNSLSPFAVVSLPDSDGDGVADVSDSCPNSNLSHCRDRRL